MSLSNGKINQLIGVQESFHASYKLTEIMNDKNKRVSLFQDFLKLEKDLSFDWFTDYFQQEHSDRKQKKQDFTPDGVIEVMDRLLGDTTSNADLCAGTGGLTIKRWNSNKKAVFYLEEFSDRALPFLLFNLSIRNINAIVAHGDSLERNFKSIYKLSATNDFSDIEVIDEVTDFKTQSIIMNPPYSLPWSRKSTFKMQERFIHYGMAPKSKADFAFLLTGFERLDKEGVMAIILPHGVLFRGSHEEKIRTNLINRNEVHAVIGLPGNLFYNTQIPTVILVLKKNKKDNNVLFIDASESFEKNKSINVLTKKHVNEILKTYEERNIIERFSNLVTISEIKENDYNLNIPRYVDTYIPPEVPKLSDVMKAIAEIDVEIKQNEHKIAEMLNDLVGTNDEADWEIKEFAKFYSDRVGYIKDNNISVDKRNDKVIEVVTEEVDVPQEERQLSLHDLFDI